jgi:hypothetical protein
MENEGLSIQPDILDFIHYMLDDKWAKEYIDRLLKLDHDQLDIVIKSESSATALDKLGLSEQDVRMKYWREEWIPRLLELFRTQVEQGDRGARIFAGKIVNSPKPLTPPDWLIKAWYKADCEAYKGRGKQDAELFETKLKIYTLYALASKWEEQGRIICKAGSTQDLIAEYTHYSKTKVQDDKKQIAKMTAAIEEMPDTIIAMLAALSKIDQADFENFLEIKDP